MLPNGSGGDQAIVEIGEINQAIATPATITGTVFEDVNQSGTYNAGVEPFLAGDTVYVDLKQDGTFDAGDPSTTTNNVGNYTLTVDPGTYEIRVVPRPGFHQDPPGYYPLTITGGQTDIVNLGENNTTTITGNVFLDTAGIGSGVGAVPTGQTPLVGERVFIDLPLLDTFIAPIPNTPDPSTGGFDTGDPNYVTGANGQFTFSDLAAGTYRLEIVSAQNLVMDTPSFFDITVTHGEVAVCHLGEGAPASITGTVFNDLNGNGKLDANEPGIANEQVFADLNNNGVYDANGTWSDSLPITFPEFNGVTDANGNYNIDNLGPGTYTLRLTYPSGAVMTDPQNLSHSYTVTLGSGENLTNQDFGYTTPSLAVSIIKFPLQPTLDAVLQKATIRVANNGAAGRRGGWHQPVCVSQPADQSRHRLPRRRTCRPGTGFEAWKIQRPEDDVLISDTTAGWKVLRVGSGGFVIRR